VRRLRTRARRHTSVQAYRGACLINVTDHMMWRTMERVLAPERREDCSRSGQLLATATGCEKVKSPGSGSVAAGLLPERTAPLACRTDQLRPATYKVMSEAQTNVATPRQGRNIPFWHWASLILPMRTYNNPAFQAPHASRVPEQRAVGTTVPGGALRITLGHLQAPGG
jgi:hypothetical protein